MLTEAARADAAGPGAALVGCDAERILTLVVGHLRQDRTRLREEWVTRIRDAHLLEGVSPQERDLVTTSVYDIHLVVLETGSLEASKHFARNLSQRIVPRGVEAQEVLGIVLRLHDVLARSLFERYQSDLGLLNRVLDAYQPVANRIAATVAFSCDEERAPDPSAADDPMVALELARAEIATLNEALRTRTTIATAIGLLMHKKSLSSDAAFALLVEVSSHTNIKIRELAARMVEEAGAAAKRADADGQDPVAAARRRVGAMTSRSR